MEIKKDFEKWHQEKAAIHESGIRVFFDEREVWFCALGANVGFEQDGAGNLFLRPVVIFRKFNYEIFLGIPLTRSMKSGVYYFELSQEPRSIAVLSQVRLFDAKRLRYKIGFLSEEKFALLKKAFLDMVTPAQGGGGPEPIPQSILVVSPKTESEHTDMIMQPSAESSINEEFQAEK